MPNTVILDKDFASNILESLESAKVAAEDEEHRLKMELVRINHTINHLGDQVDAFGQMEHIIPMRNPKGANKTKILEYMKSYDKVSIPQLANNLDIKVASIRTVFEKQNDGEFVRDDRGWWRLKEEKNVS